MYSGGFVCREEENQEHELSIRLRVNGEETMSGSCVQLEVSP